MTGQFIGVDWGTTNRRAFLIDGGTVTDSVEDACGAASLHADAYPASVAALRARLGNVPMLIAGMAGSAIGWHEVPYRPVPAGLDDLGRGLLRIDARTAMVPGVSWRRGSHGDVMRGEEVQMLGAAASGLVPADAVLCQPGTHCKWAELSGGRITRFTTAMTGELFALVSHHSLLAAQMTEGAGDDAAFDAGLAEGANRDLAASLFGIRARALLGLAEGMDAASFASGLLIGADVAARLEDYGGRLVHVLATPLLGARYARAIAALGGSATIIDSQHAFVAGITRIAKDMA